jgi:hypothetical protein
MSEQLLAEQAWVRILRHLDQSWILSEDELRRDFRTTIRQAEIATKIVLNINIRKILEGAALIAGPSGRRVT